jgi:hypothetical protein
MEAYAEMDKQKPMNETPFNQINQLLEKKLKKEKGI